MIECTKYRRWGGKGARKRMVTTEKGAADRNICQAGTTAFPLPRPRGAPLLVSCPFYLSFLSPGISPSFGRSSTRRALSGGGDREINQQIGKRGNGGTLYLQNTLSIFYRLIRQSCTPYKEGADLGDFTRWRTTSVSGINQAMGQERKNGAMRKEHDGQEERRRATGPPAPATFFGWLRIGDVGSFKSFQGLLNLPGACLESPWPLRNLF